MRMKREHFITGLFIFATMQWTIPANGDPMPQERAAPPTRDEIVKHLIQFEASVKTCSAEFDFISLPTGETQIAVIRHVIETQFRDVPPDTATGRTTKEEEYKHYILTPRCCEPSILLRPSISRRTTNAVGAICIGQTGPSQPLIITAFDGKFVQTLYQNAERTKDSCSLSKRAYCVFPPNLGVPVLRPPLVKGDSRCDGLH